MFSAVTSAKPGLVWLGWDAKNAPGHHKKSLDTTKIPPKILGSPGGGCNTSSRPLSQEKLCVASLFYQGHRKSYMSPTCCSLNLWNRITSYYFLKNKYMLLYLPPPPPPTQKPCWMKGVVTLNILIMAMFIQTVTPFSRDII